jgi:hypothetical protein
MIWLDLTDDEGRGCYLDVRGIEARHRRGETLFAISGVLGDGVEEAEVLVEVGPQVEVTFLDDVFPGRLEPEALRCALAEAVAAMAFCIESFPSLEERPRQRVTGYRAEGHWLPLRPQRYGEQLELPLVVAEAAA